MADTTVATGLRVQQWDEKFYQEFLNENIFSDFQGMDSNSIVQVKEVLTKKQGDSVTYALVNRLTNDATTGSAVLEGNEEDLASRSFRVYVDKRRHAVRIAEMEEQKSAIPLREAGRAELMNWLMEDTRDRYIEALGSINGVAYASATETQKDAWLVDNADRVLFGAAKSNAVSNDHSTALGLIDATNDRLTPNALSLMKRIARTASPKIRPIRVSGDNHYYLVLAGSNTFRDLKTHATITQAQREVSLAEQNRRLFTQAGDIQWDNLLIREVPDIPRYTGVADSGGAASPVWLLGAQALALAVARRAKTITKEFDYGDKFGVAVDQIDGIRKMLFGSGAGDTDDLKDHGIVTGWFWDAADA